MTILYCDGLREVNIISGVARLDFHRLEPAGAPNEVRAVSELVLAMPVLGFAQAVAIFVQVRDQLIRDGVIKAEPEPPADAAAPAVRSPNFP